jgi:hypothetical protein
MPTAQQRILARAIRSAGHGRSTFRKKKGVQAKPTREQVARHVGKQLKKRRKEMGLTQAGLGALVDYPARISQVQIGKYESGENEMRGSRLWGVAQTLGVSVNYFFAELGTSNS